jgi:hypothetical protein
MFTISIDGGILSSVSGLVQPVHKSRLDMKSCTIECPCSCIDGDCDIVTPFCDIHHECNLLTSELKSSKSVVPCGNVQRRSVQQNSARCGKMISSANMNASAMRVFADNIESSIEQQYFPPIVSSSFIACLCFLMIGWRLRRPRFHSESFDVKSASV